MNRGSPLHSAYTVHHNWIGLSDRRPVFVNSPKDDCRHAGPLLPVEYASPGRHEREVVVDAERQDPRPHNHDYYEICIVREGVAAHHTEQKYDELRARTVIVMAPGMTHAIYGLRDLAQTNVYYLAEWLADDLSSYMNEVGLVPLFLAQALFRRPPNARVPRFTLTQAEMARACHELADIEREADRDAPSRTLLKSSLLKLLILLSRACVRQAPAEYRLAFRIEVYAGLERIEQAILQGERFRVSVLADQANLSVNHFSTVFKGATGWAPMDYYQHRRTQHAARLLLDAGRSVTTVAHTLGYCDAAHLCHLFTRYQGMSPTRYRAVYRAAERAPEKPGSPGSELWRA